MTLPRGVPYALSVLVRYAVLLGGLLLALTTLGFDLTRLTLLLSALGLGLGFGLQQVVHDFVSGLILLFERPVQIGDTVQLGELVGDVTRIGIRSSTVRTADGAEVIVPNSAMTEANVTNWTLSDRRRRVTLDVSVAHGGDPATVLGLLRDVAGRDPRVAGAPSPEALFVRMGRESLDFELRMWTDDPAWARVRSDVGVAVERALREANIALPRPEGFFARSVSD
jgi:small-conductance mechanosensitive channel